MRKITKLTMAALGLAIAGSALVFNPTTTEAKTTYVTTTTASKKIVALQKKAYESKKKVSTSFKFKAKSPSAFKKEAYKKAAKLQWGKAYRSEPNSITRCFSFCATSYGDTSFYSWKATKVKTGVYSCKLTINGNSSAYRREYRDNNARRIMINRITSITKGMNQFDKFYVTACWVQTYAHYWGGSLQMVSDYDFMKGRYKGVCADMADVLARYAKWAGVKNVGVAASYAENHAWCYMEVDGTKYYYDPSGGSHARVTNRKEALEALDEKSSALDFLLPWYQENVDSSVKSASSLGELWNKMTAEQKKAYQRDMGVTLSSSALYTYSCDSYSKTQLLPAKLFKEENGIKVKISKWGHQRY